MRQAIGSMMSQEYATYVPYWTQRISINKSYMYLFDRFSKNELSDYENEEELYENLNLLVQQSKASNLSEIVAHLNDIYNNKNSKSLNIPRSMAL